MSDVGPAVRTMQVPGAERKQEISPEQVASSVTAVAEQVRKQYRVATDEKKASKYQNEITTKYWREVSARISANYMFSQVIICLLVGGGLSAASQEEEQAVTNLTAFFCSAFFLEGQFAINLPEEGRLNYCQSMCVALVNQLIRNNKLPDSIPIGMLGFYYTNPATNKTNSHMIVCFNCTLPICDVIRGSEGFYCDCNKLELYAALQKSKEKLVVYRPPSSEDLDRNNRPSCLVGVEALNYVVSLLVADERLATEKDLDPLTVSYLICQQDRNIRCRIDTTVLPDCSKLPTKQVEFRSLVREINLALRFGGPNDIPLRLRNKLSMFYSQAPEAMKKFITDALQAKLKSGEAGAEECLQFIRGLDRGNEVKAALSAVSMPPAVVSLVMDYDASAEGAVKDSKVIAVHRS